MTACCSPAEQVLEPSLSSRRQALCKVPAKGQWADAVVCPLTSMSGMLVPEQIVVSRHWVVSAATAVGSCMVHRGSYIGLPGGARYR